MNSLYRYQIEKIINLSIEWCFLNLGVRKWCPNITVDIVTEDIEFGAGWYLPYRHESEIGINLKCNTTILDLIDTIIHEYTHYLRPNFQKEYEKVSKEFTYDKNPLEIEAKQMARRHRKKCFTYVQNQITSGRN